MQKLFKYIFAFLFCLAGFAIDSSAQFKEEAFQQSYASQTDSTAVSDTAAKLFSFKDWAGGMSRKHTIKVGTMFAGSLFMPGRTVIYTGHEPMEFFPFCDQLLFLGKHPTLYSREALAGRPADPTRFCDRYIQLFQTHTTERSD